MNVRLSLIAERLEATIWVTGKGYDAGRKRACGCDGRMRVIDPSFLSSDLGLLIGAKGHARDQVDRSSRSIADVPADRNGRERACERQNRAPRIRRHDLRCVRQRIVELDRPEKHGVETR